jgi:hypothetical protein
MAFSGNRNAEYEFITIKQRASSIISWKKWHKREIHRSSGSKPVQKETA